MITFTKQFQRNLQLLDEDVGSRWLLSLYPISTRFAVLLHNSYLK